MQALQLHETYLTIGVEIQQHEYNNLKIAYQ